MDIDQVPSLAEKIAEEAYESCKRAAEKEGFVGEPVRLNISPDGNWQIHSTSELFSIATSVPLTQETTESKRQFQEAVADALELSIMPKSVDALRKVLEKHISPKAAQSITVKEMPLADYNAALQHGALEGDEHGFYIKLDNKLELGIYETEDIYEAIDMLEKSHPKKDIVAQRVDSALKSVGIETSRKDTTQTTIVSEKEPEIPQEETHEPRRESGRGH